MVTILLGCQISVTGISCLFQNVLIIHSFSRVVLLHTWLVSVMTILMSCLFNIIRVWGLFLASIPYCKEFGSSLKNTSLEVSPIEQNIIYLRVDLLKIVAFVLHQFFIKLYICGELHQGNLPSILLSVHIYECCLYYL